MANKIKKKTSKRNVKNTLVALSGIAIGIIATIGGVLLLMDKEKIIEKNQVTLNTELQSCKAFGAKKGFRISEPQKGEVEFYRRNLSPDNSFSAMVGMQGVVLNCKTMKLEKACVGWECDEKIPKSAMDDTLNMPFYFKLSEIYERNE